MFASTKQRTKAGNGEEQASTPHIDAEKLKRSVVVCQLVPVYYHLTINSPGPASGAHSCIEYIKAGKFKGQPVQGPAFDPLVVDIKAHWPNVFPAVPETVPERYGRGVLGRLFQFVSRVPKRPA